MGKRKEELETPAPKKRRMKNSDIRGFVTVRNETDKLQQLLSQNIEDRPTRDQAEQRIQQGNIGAQPEQGDPGSTGQAEQQHPGADKTSDIRQSLTTPRAVARSVNCPIITSDNQSLAP